MRQVETAGRKILPGIWQLNRTTYIVRAQPRDPRTGKKRNIRRLLENSSRQDALAMREDLLAGVDSSVQTPTSQETVGAFVEWWLKYKGDRGDIEPSTLDRYALALGHLSPRILEATLGDLTVTMIEEWMIRAARRRPGGKDGRTPERYAPRTINSWLRVLRTVMTDAARLRGVHNAAATSARPLKEPVNLEETNSLSPAELAKVLITLREVDPIVALAAWTQAWTGMRWGEVSALQWKDLDVEARVLTIRRKVQGGRLVPRTKTGRLRKVGVPVPLLEALLGHREALGAPGNSTLMFSSSVGKPIHSSRISVCLRRACESAKIEQRFTSHGFRRSMTDMLREASIDPVVAKAITGHSTDRMREHYSTVSGKNVRDASDATAALFGGKLELIQGGADDSVAEESTEESTAALDAKTAG